jgi:hypothetical protein
MNNAVFKTDDTGAFGNSFITITVKNPNLYPISKILAVTNSGCCIDNKVFTDPDNFQREEITLTVNYSSDESAKLNQGANNLNLVAYDDKNRQKTCPQTLIFYAQNGVITRNGQPCC